MIFSGKKGRKRRRIVLVETLKIEENSLKKKGVSWEKVITHTQAHLHTNKIVKIVKFNKNCSFCYKYMSLTTHMYEIH